MCHCACFWCLYCQLNSVVILSQSNSLTVVTWPLFSILLNHSTMIAIIKLCLSPFPNQSGAALQFKPILLLFNHWAQKFKSNEFIGPFCKAIYHTLLVVDQIWTAHILIRINLTSNFNLLYSNIITVLQENNFLKLYMHSYLFGHTWFS